MLHKTINELVVSDSTLLIYELLVNDFRNNKPTNHLVWNDLKVYSRYKTIRIFKCVTLLHFNLMCTERKLDRDTIQSIVQTRDYTFTISQ